MTVFDVITLFPEEIANLECFDSKCLVPNRIYSVLPRWRDNLLSISRLLKDNKLSPKMFSIIFMCFPDTITGQSRQHRVLVCRRQMLRSISLTYIKKRRGPRIDPCGNPQGTTLGSEKIPLTSVTYSCILFVRYASNQAIAFSSRPIAFSLFSRID